MLRGRTKGDEWIKVIARCAAKCNPTSDISLLSSTSGNNSDFENENRYVPNKSISKCKIYGTKIY